MSNPSDNEYKSPVFPTFGGQQNQFQSWHQRFLSYAGMCGFKEALRSDFENKLPDTEEPDELTIETAAQKEARAKNMKAMHHLRMAIQCGTCLNVVDSVGTESWPGGKAYQAMEKLRKKYMPSDDVAEMEFAQELKSVTMTKTQDPSVLFDQIREIVNRYKMSPSVSIKTKDIELLIIQKLPKEYISVIKDWLKQSQSERGQIGNFEQNLHEYWRLARHLRS